MGTVASRPHLGLGKLATLVQMWFSSLLYGAQWRLLAPHLMASQHLWSYAGLHESFGGMKERTHQAQWMKCTSSWKLYLAARMYSASKMHCSRIRQTTRKAKT